MPPAPVELLPVAGLSFFIPAALSLDVLLPDMPEDEPVEEPVLEPDELEPEPEPELLRLPLAPLELSPLAGLFFFMPAASSVDVPLPDMPEDEPVPDVLDDEPLPDLPEDDPLPERPEEDPLPDAPEELPLLPMELELPEPIELDDIETPKALAVLLSS